MSVNMVTIDREEFEMLRNHLPAVTKDGFRDVYQIGQTTWYKLRDGKPVRQSTRERLREKLRRLQAH